MSDDVISDEDFRRFREYFYRKTGIHFDDGKRYFVDKRLMERMQATGSTRFGSYFSLLRLDASGGELQQLVNLMTVNETYFFREEYQLRCLVGSMLDEVTRRRRNGAAIRVWSIPSSTGEEPFSIALYLLEHWPGIAEWDVEITSSDIDTDVLSQARRGHFSPRSVQHLPPALLAKYFTAADNGYQLDRAVRDTVEFTRVNLMDPADLVNYREFDVIFCRNLLIYFDDLSRRQAAASFYDALRPGGFLCLGHSESTSRVSSLFQVRKLPEAIVYQRPREPSVVVP